MTTWILLLIIAGVLIIVEIALQMVWALCLAVGFAMAALLSVFNIDWPWIATVAAILTIVFYVAMIPVLNRWQIAARRRRGKEGRTGMDALLGRVAIVTDEIRPGHLGRARIDGDYWQVRMPGATEVVDRGREVIVTGYDSIILDVISANNN